MFRSTLAVLSVAAVAVLVGWHFWPAADKDPAPVAAAPAAETSAPVESAAPPPPTPQPQPQSVEIGRRDTIGAALSRQGIAATDVHAIAQALRDAGADLRRVRPGDSLQLTRAADGSLLSVAYSPSAWQRFEAVAEGDHWASARRDIEPEIRVEMREAEVENSLWDAVQAGTVSPQMLLDLAQIFESEVDFAADVRPGDRFRMLVELRYADGELVDHGRILAAQYVNDGQTLTGIGFDDGERFAYYDPEGRSLKKMFLRSPLQFTRISSGFTHRRPHPILGGVRPHLAIDYAAPTGTPVWAVADGVVRIAGRRGGNGIQVRVRHRAGYETYYNHLSRIAKGVRPGVRVRQKQVIGYVGSTGLSTGPHLDYRVAKKGTFVNPLNEKFIPGKPIPTSLRSRYAEQSRSLMARLQRDPAPGSADTAGAGAPSTQAPKTPTEEIAARSGV